MPLRAPNDAGARPDASMSLLTNLMEHALDEGYAEAAERRLPGERWRPGWILGIGMVAVGLLLVTAAAETRQRAPSAADARARLSDEITARTEQTDKLQQRVERLRNSVTRAQQDALGLTSAGSRAATELAILELQTGAVAVTGPGLVVHIEDAPDARSPAGADPRSKDNGSDGRVSDRDLQTIVNEVWASGAEAVAVNDQRLTSLSAIRSAGEAILVDFRPLSPPYDVVAVGRSTTLRSRLAAGLGGSYLQVLRNYGITSSVDIRKKVTLPAASGLPVRFASVPSASVSAPAASPSSGTRS